MSAKKPVKATATMADAKAAVTPKPPAAAAAPKSNLDLLLDLDAPPMGLPALTPAAVDTTAAAGGLTAAILSLEHGGGGGAAEAAAPMWVASNSTELLNKERRA